MLSMKGRLNGSSVDVFSINGKPQVLSCGFTGNVCPYLLSFSVPSVLIMANLIAGAGKSILWSVRPYYFRLEVLT
jgi:hypothetical protein